jgi:hypothetical protein
VRGWIGERLPAGRELDRPALAALAEAIGRERSLWLDLTCHDPEERTFVELYRDVHVDVWLQCWMNQQDTGYHDHDLSAGAVYVCDGVLVEDRLQRVDGAITGVPRAHPAGTGFDFDAACIHRMHHVDGPEATSIHCYSPAIWRMGHYSFDADGNFARASVTYADEMWSGRIESLRFTP